jgi:G2/mitotic-specific cyclin 3/4
MIMDCCENPEKHHAAVYDKYADKKYKRAAIFVAAEMKNNFTLPPPPPSILRSSLPSTEEEYAPMTSEIEPYTRMVQIKG